MSKTLLEFRKGEWENTKNYDEVITVIGRNRKLLSNKFMNLQQRKVPITFEVAKDVTKEILDFSRVKMENANWPSLLKFAERDGLIEVKKLLSVFKDRFQNSGSIPRAKVLYI